MFHPQLSLDKMLFHTLKFVDCKCLLRWCPKIYLLRNMLVKLGKCLYTLITSINMTPAHKAFFNYAYGDYDLICEGRNFDNWQKGQPRMTLLTTRVLRHKVPAGARGSNAAARSHTFIFLKLLINQFKKTGFHHFRMRYI